jgi:cation diffusion facilitator family transporter
MLDNKAFLTTVSLLVTMVLVALKALASVWSGSISLLAELLNNSMDIVTALVALLVVRWSDRPADESHPYGHGKAESLGALVTASLLIITYIIVGFQAFHRLVNPQPLQHLDWAALAVAFGIGVNLFRQWAFARAARQQRSQQLAAEALNFRMDIAASLVTLAALGLAALLPQAALLADPLGALIVVAGALTLAVRLALGAIDTLLDRAPLERIEPIRQAVLEIDGVAAVPLLRVREVGTRCFVELVTAIPRTLSLEAAHDLANQIEERIRNAVADAEVLVHTEPVAESNESLVEAIQRLAARHGYAVHNVCAYVIDEAVYAHLDLEVDGASTLQAAHAQASDLEARIEQTLGIAHVWVHIEPTADVTQARTPPDLPVLADQIAQAAAHVPEVRRVHNLRIDQAGEDVLVSLDCQFDPHISVADAHLVAERFEAVLRRRLRRLGRVSIHTEPFDAVDQ